MSNLKDLQKRALVVANHYDDYNRVKGRKTWDLNDYIDGLVGDVGDLMKLVMTFRQRRDGLEETTLLDKTEHELNDVLWSLLILYKMFRIDPDESFVKAMDALEARVVALKKEAKNV